MSQELLDKLIRKVGEDWLIDSYSPSESAVTSLQCLLDEANERARERGIAGVPEIAELMAEHERNPHKLKAFLQALGSTESPDMVLMVWRIIQGAAITGLKIEYELQKTFSLQVTLQADQSGHPEAYHSSRIDDAALLRHLGIMTMGGAPIFDGFYPL